MQHNVRCCNQVGLLTAGGERGWQSGRAAPFQWRASYYVLWDLWAADNAGYSGDSHKQ